MLFIIFFKLQVLCQNTTTTNSSSANIVKQITSTCLCQQILNENDCNQYCLWNKNLSACFDLRCQDTLDESTCSKATGCAFINSTCVEFTSCESLEPKNKTQDCTVKYATQCSQDVNGDCVTTSTQLNLANLICVNISPQDCNLQQETLSGKYCINNSTCTPVKFTSCSQATKFNWVSSFVEVVCTISPYCTYNATDNTCSQAVCSHLTKEECDFNNFQLQLFGTSPTTQSLCTWNSTTNTCDEGFDINTLDESNCYSDNTMSLFTWDPVNKICTQCPGFGTMITSLFIFYFSF